MPLTLPNLGRQVLGIHPFSSAWWTSIYPFRFSPVHYLEKIGQIFQNVLGFPGGSVVKKKKKNPPIMQEMRVRSLDGEDPLVAEMAIHAGILAWKIPWTGSLVAPCPWGYHSVRYDWTRMHSECINHFLFCQADTTGLFSLVTGTSVYCVIPVPRTAGYVLSA